MGVPVTQTRGEEMGASQGQWEFLSHRQEERKWEPVRDNGSSYLFSSKMENETE
jgi:hypothetical protein